MADIHKSLDEAAGTPVVTKQVLQDPDTPVVTKPVFKAPDTPGITERVLFAPATFRLDFQIAIGSANMSRQNQSGSRKISFNVSDQYDIQDVVGEGAYGVVW